ncbi:MAG: hypothetical protein PHP35_01240 [Candidatus Colwellbacteria bacterium]|nr:hypothetical protein [Candidatus Colwellbacteria bacterium]
MSRGKENVIFQEGNFVTLNGNMAQLHGEGPFRVADVCWVPSRCTCGAKGLYGHDVKLGDHEAWCDVQRRKTMEHPQLVTIETSDGLVCLSGVQLTLFDCE